MYSWVVPRYSKFGGRVFFFSYLRRTGGAQNLPPPVRVLKSVAKFWVIVKQKSHKPKSRQPTGASLLQLRQDRHGKNQAVFGHNQIVSMVSNIRIRMLTLLVVNLPDTQENRTLSSDDERAVLQRTKLMPNPVYCAVCF